MANFIEPYNPGWQTEFEKLQSVLHSKLNPIEHTIQHIGSTAIPGLCAKPILDIDIIINNRTLLGEVSARLEGLGYVNKGEQGIEGRFAFRQSSPYTPLMADNHKWQAHHLYVCFSDSLALKNHLLFRDILLRDTELVGNYSKLKTELMTVDGITREEYTKRKTEFILSVLASGGLDERELNKIKDANS